MKKRLQDLCSSINVELAPCICGQLVWYLEEMLRWNRSINLTAITKPDEAIEKHLIDCLTVVPLLKGDELLLDMGSGAGLPGIPLKIARPTLRVLSVDSVLKKIVFQQHVARSLGLQSFEAKACRIEALAAQSDYNGLFNVVTARALTHLSQLIEMAHPFLIAGGRLLAMKGPEASKELDESENIMSNSGFVMESVHRMTLPLSHAERVLVVLKREFVI